MEKCNENIFSKTSLISLLQKKGDLNSIRQAAKYIYNKETGKFMDLASGEAFEAPQADKN